MMDALSFVRFSKLLQWDIKRLVRTDFSSQMPVVALGDHIVEQSQKYDISNPKQQYGILGVNNKTGIFDAYQEIGSNIHQKYKKMEVGWIAYNPYRVNVGSIGIKRSEHNYDYISPAYVVFSCVADMLPDYLYLLMKTPSFNKIIRENTTGSVRQNLSFSTLKNLRIPFPRKSIQEKIISKYHQTIAEAEAKEAEAEQLESKIQPYLLGKLGVDNQVMGEDSYYGSLRIIHYRMLSKWGYDYLSGRNGSILESKLYKNVPLNKLMDVNPSTSFVSLNQDTDISFVPMECVSDVYGELEERRTIKLGLSKGYTKFQEGDLIWARITPCMQNGKSAIVSGLQNGLGCGSTEFHVLRKSSPDILTEYVYCLLRTRHILNDAKKYFTGSAGQQRVPKTYLEQLSIPLPPIDVQNEIIDHISEMKGRIKLLKQEAATLRDKALKDFENEIFE